MANILLISINDINAEGLRTLSSRLKTNGHNCGILFLKRPSSVEIRPEEVLPEDWVGINESMKLFRYARGGGITLTEESVLIRLINEISPDLIGVSVTTPLKQRAAHITKLLRKEFELKRDGGAMTLTTEDVINCLKYLLKLHFCSN